MAALYRCSVPTNWLCPCGKIARALRSEGIAFEEVRMPQRRARRDEVMSLTGQSRVPVLVIEGQAICDSRRIREYLAFRREREPERPGSPQPAGSPRRAR